MGHLTVYLGHLTSISHHSNLSIFYVSVMAAEVILTHNTECTEYEARVKPRFLPSASAVQECGSVSPLCNVCGDKATKFRFDV